MSDYDSDGDIVNDNNDNNNGFDTETDDDDVVQDEDNQQNVQNVQNDPNDPVFKLNENKKEFNGSNNHKNNWIQCFYCTKYHPITMHLPDMGYCGHCWAWLNSDQLKLTEGTYNGPNTIDEVKNFLKLTYSLHPTTCTNNECIYNKIKQLADEKTLHWDFCVELGFVREEKKSSNDTNSNNTNSNIKKRGYTRINYKSSSIII